MISAVWATFLGSSLLSLSLRQREEGLATLFTGSVEDVRSLELLHPMQDPEQQSGFDHTG